MFIAKLAARLSKETKQNIVLKQIKQDTKAKHLRVAKSRPTF